MDSAYQSGCNCIRDCACDSGFSCCSQKGNEKVFGLCIKNENGCNKETGLAKVRGSNKVENFVLTQSPIPIHIKEGYSSGSDCSEWNKVVWILSFVIFVLLFLLVSKTI